MLSDALELIICNKLNLLGVMHILNDFFIALPPTLFTAVCHLLTLFTHMDILLAQGKELLPLYTTKIH